MNRNGAEETLHRLWRYRRIRIICKVIFLAAMSALAAYGQRITLPISFMGRRPAIVWITPIIIGRLFVNRNGAGLLIGAMAGAMAIPMVQSNSAVYNIGLYIIIGIFADITALLPGIDIRNAACAVFSGIVLHLSLYSYVLLHLLIISDGSIVMKTPVETTLKYMAWGTTAGLIAWIIYFICEKCRTSTENKIKVKEA